MNVVFRADASLSIGAGHLSRCLTLAESLKRRGADVTFVCAAGSCAFVPRVSEIADAVVELPHSAAEVDRSTNDAWLTVAPTNDAEMTITALAGMAVDWLVVDHYGIDATWESLLRPLVGKVMVIDDLANRNHDCDLLLDQNLRPEGAASYSGLVPPGALVMQGPEFALLRDEFTVGRQRHDRTDLSRILVSFGGVDGANGTALALGALDALDSKGSFVDVVIGARHPDRDGIVEHCRNLGYLCHVQTSEIANLMDAADLAIGAGGASSWERCIVGLPTVIVVTAENQALIATELAERGAAVNLGPIATVSATMIADNIHGLQQDPRRLKQMSLAAYGLLNDRTDVSELIYRGF